MIETALNQLKTTDQAWRSELKRQATALDLIADNTKRDLSVTIPLGDGNGEVHVLLTRDEVLQVLQYKRSKLLGKTADLGRAINILENIK